MKKLITFALALAMTFALSVPAFAEDTIINQGSDSNQGKTIVTYDVAETYTVVIPESTVLGEPFDVKATNVNLAPKMKLTVTVSELDENHKFSLARTNDTDYKVLTGLNYKSGEDFTVYMKDTSLTLCTADNAAGALTFKTDDSVIPAVGSDPIKAGKYTGTLTFTIAYSTTEFQFTINGTPCTAVEGMTWGEWLNSSYKSSAFDFTVVGSDIHVKAFILRYNDDMVETQHLIIPGAQYYLGGS